MQRSSVIPSLIEIVWVLWVLLHAWRFI